MNASSRKKEKIFLTWLSLVAATGWRGLKHLPFPVLAETPGAAGPAGITGASSVIGPGRSFEFRRKVSESLIDRGRQLYEDHLGSARASSSLFVTHV